MDIKLSDEQQYLNKSDKIKNIIYYCESTLLMLMDAYV